MYLFDHIGRIGIRNEAQLADKSGVNARQIQRVELGEADAGDLTARNLIALADALDMDAKHLL